jgi:hypothetical protein
VLVTATGCRNLWETKTLLLRRAFGILTPDQADRLQQAHPADIRTGRWFRWLYLAGLAVAAGYFVLWYGPVLLATLQWTGHSLATGPRDGEFWLAAACAIPLYLPIILAVGLWLTELRQRLFRHVTRAQ